MCDIQISDQISKTPHTEMQFSLVHIEKSRNTEYNSASAFQKAGKHRAQNVAPPPKKWRKIILYQYFIVKNTSLDWVGS